MIFGLTCGFAGVFEGFIFDRAFKASWPDPERQLCGGIERLSMAGGGLFDIALEAAIEGHRGASLLEDLQRFGEQARAGRIAGEEPGDDAGIGLDEDLVAVAGPGDEPIEVTGRFGARYVDDRHGAMIPVFGVGGLALCIGWVVAEEERRAFGRVGARSARLVLRTREGVSFRSCDLPQSSLSPEFLLQRMEETGKGAFRLDEELDEVSFI
jgi:hypothetical protein